MCVSHSRGATYQINGAREVQGERRAEVRSSYAKPQPSLVPAARLCRLAMS